MILSATIRWFLFPLLLWSALVASSLFWSLGQIERYEWELGANQGRDIFRVIEATRLWNARQGSVYVEQGHGTDPNPYLDVPERDPVTVSGKRLTMLNPAYMTRQLAGTIFEQTGIRIHITSNNPINPGNRSDSWERWALESFQTGENREVAEIIANGSSSRVMRYIAPLVAKPPCLDCHAKQGYKVGDVRGGISVTFPMEQIEKSLAGQRQLIWVSHLSIWGVVYLILWWGIRQLRASWAELRSAKEGQEALVLQRTVELRREIDERRHAESHLRHMLNASGSGIFGIDGNGCCSFCNPVALHLLGYTHLSDMLGDQIQNTAFRHDEALARRILSASGDASIHEEDVLFSRADGSTLPVEFTLETVLVEGEVMGRVITFNDISERKKQHDRIWRQANYDALTGLANRNYLETRLHRMIRVEALEGEHFALLFLDLDGFKEVNDTWGHEAGDEVLRDVARRMESCVRESDLAARLGGDEFIVLLHHVTGRGNVTTVADKLLARLAQPYLLADGGEAHLSASIGIAFYPEDAMDCDTLLRHADAAMYAAKQAGKNRYRFFGGQAE